MFTGRDGHAIPDLEKLIAVTFHVETPQPSLNLDASLN